MGGRGRCERRVDLRSRRATPGCAIENKAKPVAGPKKQTGIFEEGQGEIRRAPERCWEQRPQQGEWGCSL